MPHTNRKKKPSGTAEKISQPQIVRTKRRQIEDNDGWTHVIDTPRKAAQVNAKERLHAGDFERNGVSYINRTPEEMNRDWEYYRQQWENNEACGDLKRELVGEKKEGKLLVENVVCLGLGSLQNARREGRRASFTQLAALRTIMELLAGETKLQCFLQDPQFTDVDKEFLTSLGYKVVEDPLAFNHITDSSLVYAIHCYADIYKSVSEGPRPAMMMGTDVESFGRFNLSETVDSVAKSLEEMVKDYEDIEFPQVRHDFSDTKIYWRRITELAKA